MLEPCNRIEGRAGRVSGLDQSRGSGTGILRQYHVQWRYKVTTDQNHLGTGVHSI
ncbi:hypothetical protein PVK06_030035 [Gossypium arboreum]|uniref:Uncharacterized protein n=1 Tax=Gossypium arboreum TaxID=29729 RepID=A0ABR0NMQ6_GOSAR|nr:hypothetical protein PVK06_030035 [Gossypium arboreum]